MTLKRSGGSRATATLLLLLLLAFGLRMVRIGELRMWGDEGYSVYSAQRSLVAITTEGAENDPHPPLYYYLLHFYLPLAGTSELALRFFSVFPGLATVALLYAIGKRAFSRRVGMAAAAVGAIAPFHIYYSQEIRMYALAVFLTALALYWFVRLWQAGVNVPLRNRLWLAYAVTMLLAMYTLYHTAFVFLAEGLVLLPFLKTRRAFVLRWFAVSATIVVLFLPWLLLRWSATLGHLEDRAGHNVQSLPVFVARGFAALTVGTTLPLANAQLGAALVLALLLLGLGLLILQRSTSSVDLLLLALAAVPIVAVYPLYLLLPILVGRLFALAFVPLALVLARAVLVFGTRARLAMVPAALLLVGVSAYSLDDYYFRFDRYDAAAEDYIPLIQAIERKAQAGDTVLFHANWQIGYLLGHYQGPPIHYGDLGNEHDLQEAVAHSGNVWAVVQNLSSHPAEGWLDQHAFYLGEQTFGEMRLVSYWSGTPGRGTRFAVPLQFENGVNLVGYHLSDAPLEAGHDSLMLELDWQAARPVGQDYTISVRIAALASASLARRGIIWAQQDSRPAYGTLATSTWQPGQTVADHHTLLIPAGTPPAEYAVQVVMYDVANGRAASVIAPENARGQTVTLGDHIQVVRPRTLPESPAPGRDLAEWNEVALSGVEIGGEQVSAGENVPLTLHWLARQKPMHDYMLYLQLVDSTGVASPPVVLRPAADSFSTLEWAAGESWTDKLRLKVDAQTAPGRAVILLGMADAKSGEPAAPTATIPVRDESMANLAAHGPALLRMVEIGTLQITGRPHRFELPSPGHPLSAQLGENIRLLGYDLNGQTFAPGAKIPLTLYWQAIGAVDGRYTVFVHVLDSAGKLVAQQDQEPDGGQAPTTSWVQNEVIADPYTLSLPSTLAPGDYSIEAGMYDSATGVRLNVAAPSAAASSDHILLGSIRVSGP